MAVPRSRLSNSRKNKRRSHMAPKKQNLSICDNCQTPSLPHRICEACGFYKKRQVVTKKEKK
jgi:large subunit ribosomal protein L32